MTTPTTSKIDSQPSPEAADRAQTFLDWTRINSRAITIGALTVAVAAGIYAFIARSRAIESENAAKALMNAKQSMSSGNLPLAQSDLQKVFSRYGSTSAGVEAAMLLAQIDYDGGKAQDGLNVLEKAQGSRAASSTQSTILSLEGDGYAQLRKLGQAAKKYEDAAAATSFETEWAYLSAKAARTYGDAGDTAKARQIWERLVADPKGKAVVGEARVRLGELTAQVAKK
jgi:predicted negative regulator of RcsB-dependent stress response